MSESKWVHFIEVFERSHADLAVSYLEANGIETELIQEAYYEYQIGSAAMGRIEILVPDTQLEEARKLYEESGWDFDITETDDEEDEHEEDDDKSGE